MQVEIYEDTVYTDQVEYSVGMSSQFGHLSERGVLPHQDLVLRISVCADLQNTNKYFLHIYLRLKGTLFLWGHVPVYFQTKSITMPTLCRG